MSDFQSPEDEATLYVLGEFTAAERRNFEARMAQSVELRALVRDLEEGVVALSTGLPTRRPPSEVWVRVEKAVCREGRQSVPAWWMGWWRNGWAAAAVCLAGWLLYAILLNGRHGLKTAMPQPVARETAIVNSSPAPDRAMIVPLAPTNGERQLLQVRAGEIRDLRLKIAEMEGETSQLTQLLAQQRARLGETNRIKFLELTPASSAGGDATTAQLSPALQRAVLISIGQELGWLPMSANSRSGNGHAVKTVDGIDFVDLRSPVGNPGNPPPSQPQAESQTADATEPSIPAFVSGDKLIVAVDSTVAPPNSSLTFTIAGTSFSATGGSFVMGANPAVVTMPFPASLFSDGGFAVTVNSVTSTGISNVTQFITPATQ